MNELDEKLLQEVNLSNLKWLETYFAPYPELRTNGVEVLRCFTYDLIQAFNNTFLRERSNGIGKS